MGRTVQQNSPLPSSGTEMADWWYTPLIVFCGMAILVSVAVAVQFAEILRRLRWNDPPVNEPVPAGRLTAILPARNEELDIGGSLRSVLSQRDVSLEVIVVNDHSTDRTGEIAESIAREDPRVKVIHDPPLRPGWLGKCNAVQTAAEQAQGEYLLFSDADIHHEPQCFRTALAEMARHNLDFISLLPRIDCVSLFEHAVAQSFVGGLTHLAPPSIDDPKSPEAVGAGAFLLVKREVFVKVGGFEPVRTQMLDDVEFAKLMKRTGHRVAVRSAPEMLNVRLFKGNRSAFWGPTKNILAVIQDRLWMAPIVLLLPIIVFWTPLAAFAVGIVRKDSWLLSLSVTAYIVQLGLLIQGRKIFRLHPVKRLFFPLVALVTTCCLLRSLYYFVVRGSVLWRDRVVKIRGEEPAGA